MAQIGVWCRLLCSHVMEYHLLKRIELYEFIEWWQPQMTSFHAWLPPTCGLMWAHLQLMSSVCISCTFNLNFNVLHSSFLCSHWGKERLHLLLHCVSSGNFWNISTLLTKYPERSNKHRRQCTQSTIFACADGAIWISCGILFKLVDVVHFLVIMQCTYPTSDDWSRCLFYFSLSMDLSNL